MKTLTLITIMCLSTIMAQATPSKNNPDKKEKRLERRIARKQSRNDTPMQKEQKRLARKDDRKVVLGILIFGLAATRMVHNHMTHPN